MKHLLGVGPYQIDGLDDLRIHPKGQGPLIYREDSQFKQLQKTLFSRLEGRYLPHEAEPPPEQRVIGFDEKGRLKTQLGGSGSTAVEIIFKRLSPSRATLGISIGASRLLGDGWSEIYDVRMTADSQMIAMKKQNGERLICRNENFLKLICSSDREEVSLSLSEVSNPVAWLRHSRINADGKLILHVFGTFTRVSK